MTKIYEEKQRKALGVELRRLRHEAGITQRRVAMHLNLSGSYWADIEAGARPITGQRLRHVAELLGGDVEELFEIAGMCSTCAGTGQR